jgi:hypothetical protein
MDKPEIVVFRRTGRVRPWSARVIDFEPDWTTPYSRGRTEQEAIERARKKYVKRHPVRHDERRMPF